MLGRILSTGLVHMPILRFLSPFFPSSFEARGRKWCPLSAGHCAFRSSAPPPVTHRRRAIPSPSSHVCSIQILSQDNKCGRSRPGEGGSNNDSVMIRAHKVTELPLLQSSKRPGEATETLGGIQQAALPR